MRAALVHVVRAAGARHSVVVGLSVAILLDTTCQLLWKTAALRLPESLSTAALFGWLAHSALAWALVCVFALQLINWLWVLERSRLSTVQPLTALSYVTVVLSSFLLFDERLDAARLLGIFFVLLGVGLVSVDTLRYRSAK